jgi:hypothetical protein
MTFTATITKTKEAEVLGTYLPTAVDARKAAATVLITAAYGAGYDITSRVALSGRGIKHYGADLYFVTERALEAIKSAHTWATDF